jgi:hypothetical protein
MMIKIKEGFRSDLPLLSKADPSIRDTLLSWAGNAVTVLLYIIITMTLQGSGQPTIYWFAMLLNVVPVIIIIPILGVLFRFESGLWSVVHSIMVSLCMFILALLAPASDMTTVEGAWINGMVIAGLLEEFIKYIFYLSPFFAGRMRSGCQIMYWSLASGLLFGVTENINYTAVGVSTVLKTQLDPSISMENVVRAVASVRLFNTAVVHSALAFMGSLFIVYSYTGIVKKVPRWVMFILALIVPSILHGLYDVPLMLIAAKAKGQVFWTDIVAISYMTATILMTIPIIRVIRAPKQLASTLNV